MEEKQVAKKKNFDPHTYELKWQQYWEENEVYHSEIDHSKPKYYVLDMLPYPSGSGLHVGHPVGYTATDIVSRHKRQLGYNVIHPMGWDSFGLPAEQYAVRTGVHPKITTEKNIDNIRAQLKRLGFDYDWRREIKTSDPKFYKWTQWIFNKLYEKGLAYQADMMVNFCPALGTALSNEEVIDGKSAVGGHPVEKRPLRQWVLKITAYADRLLEDLEDLDWPEGIKKLQRDWIGKSSGAQLHFVEEKSQETITVFTTRQDTLFGVNCVVLAPEHPLVKKITSPEQKASVDAYVSQALNKNDLERTELSKDKTGVSTGAFCLNPVNQKPIPIWVADYVLINYGTGAVMGVPCDDKRDFEFSKKYNIPFTSVISPISSPKDIDLALFKAQVKNGERCSAGHVGTLYNSKSKELNLDGLTIEQAKSKALEWLEKSGNGEKTVNYKLRDWLFSRQRYWGEPFPILHLEDGTIRTLDLDELPLLPPESVDYSPTSDGSSPLAKSRDWMEITDPKTGKKATRESNTMPQWAGSCWYFLRYLDPNNDKEMVSKEALDYWMPVDLYVGGAEHAVLHLLYSRFWYKVLFDCGLVSTKEPFQSLRNQGLVTARSFKTSDNHYVSTEHVKSEGNSFFHKESGQKLTSQIEKMSKSKLNGINPLEIIDEFGADSLRLYSMFMGPIEKEKVFVSESINGCFRFLSKFNDLFNPDKLSDVESQEALKLGHKLVRGVLLDIEDEQFNTAISKMMIFTNEFSKLAQYPRSVLKMAVQCLYPFAPHLAYELWSKLEISDELAHAAFPTYDEAYLIEESATYVVQVNGKLRGKFDLPKNQSKEDIVKLAQENPNIAKHLDRSIVKIIFVPNKLINFVVK
ncbi:MAG: Leucine--tRNA ligase [Chlamydiae bacterium]|nr:Leucine--tRNA ligase [Chlamydiota bacterium]